MFDSASRSEADRVFSALVLGFAADPAHLGKGLGTALLAACLKKCDDDGRPAYLESTNAANLSLYRRFGFEQIGLIEADHAPPQFPMFRRPVKAAR